MDKYIFPLEATTDDIEEIERENERLKTQMKELKEFATFIAKHHEGTAPSVHHFDMIIDRARAIVGENLKLNKTA